MAELALDPRYQAYMEAIRRRVCAVCLDGRDDRSCGLTGRVCAIEAHLPQVVAALSAVQSGSMLDYEAAIRAQVCPGCEHQDDQGTCRLRDHADCALDAYLSLVLDAVEDVNQRFAARTNASTH
jgi:hypothetical protein